jgi:hypothetical protein
MSNVLKAMTKTIIQLGRLHASRGFHDSEAPEFLLGVATCHSISGHNAPITLSRPTLAMEAKGSSEASLTIYEVI